MNANGPLSKEKKDCVIRARCGRQFKDLLSTLANTLGVDESDVIRLSVRQYATVVLPQTRQLNGAQ